MDAAKRVWMVDFEGHVLEGEEILRHGERVVVKRGGYDASFDYPAKDVFESEREACRVAGEKLSQKGLDCLGKAAELSMRAAKLRAKLAG